MPKKFNSYYKFAFVRNPWDWQVSQYFFIKSTKGHFQHWLIKQMDFDQYVEWRMDRPQNGQKYFISDEEDTVIVDFVGRYENLSVDFAKVCKHLNIKTKLPHLNKASRTVRHYSKMYNNKTRDMIGQKFSRDIEYFGYTF